jgi:hypothetical protein
MNAAVTMQGADWLVRESKVVVFDLPDSDYGDDAEPIEAVEEVDPNDVLLELPMDPEQPFELRVPHMILARAAQLTAALPRHAQVAPDMGHQMHQMHQTIERRPSSRLAATVLGACIGIGLAGTMAYAATAPIEPSPSPVLKAAAPAKIVAARPVVIGSIVPTVTFDSLPRARR